MFDNITIANIKRLILNQNLLRVVAMRASMPFDKTMRVFASTVRTTIRLARSLLHVYHWCPAPASTFSNIFWFNLDLRQRHSSFLRHNRTRNPAYLHVLVFVIKSGLPQGCHRSQPTVNIRSHALIVEPVVDHDSPVIVYTSLCIDLDCCAVQVTAHGLVGLESITKSRREPSFYDPSCPS